MRGIPDQAFDEGQQSDFRSRRRNDSLFPFLRPFIRDFTRSRPKTEQIAALERRKQPPAMAQLPVVAVPTLHRSGPIQKAVAPLQPPGLNVITPPRAIPPPIFEQSPQQQGTESQQAPLANDVGAIKARIHEYFQAGTTGKTVDGQNYPSTPQLLNLAKMLVDPSAHSGLPKNWQGLSKEDKIKLSNFIRRGALVQEQSAIATKPTLAPWVTSRAGEPTLAQRNKNPCNIKASPWTVTFDGASDSGEKAQDGGSFLKFDTVEQGFAAMEKLLFTGRPYKGKTVDQALRIWSGGGYGAEIEHGISGNEFLPGLTHAERKTLIRAIAKYEGFKIEEETGQSLTPAPPLLDLDAILSMADQEVDEGQLRKSRSRRRYGSLFMTKKEKANRITATLRTRRNVDAANQ